EFKLMPTPAQRGLSRRASQSIDALSPTRTKRARIEEQPSDDFMSTIEFDRKFAQLPEFDPASSTIISQSLPSTPIIGTMRTPPESAAPIAGAVFDFSDDNIQVALMDGLNIDRNGTCRRLLDRKRNLIRYLLAEKGMFPAHAEVALFQQAHEDLFPDVSSVKMKIREVRQKAMNGPRKTHTPVPVPAAAAADPPPPPVAAAAPS
ncbi:hypothetical protein PENTCL1PPCAC_28462, partial [Pristionchus entomophagus]